MLVVMAQEEVHCSCRFHVENDHSSKIIGEAINQMITVVDQIKVHGSNRPRAKDHHCGCDSSCLKSQGAEGWK